MRYLINKPNFKELLRYLSIANICHYVKYKAPPKRGFVQTSFVSRRSGSVLTSVYYQKMPKKSTPLEVQPSAKYYFIQ